MNALDESRPKRMTFGPCGGVLPNGECEMRSGACTFDDVVPWSGVEVVGTPVRASLILTDFSCTPFDPTDLAATAVILAPSCDAVLVGEHQNRPDFPPTLMSRLLLDSGVSPWITLSCRDRNRVVLEQELRGLRLIGVQTVLCVTGDGRGYDVRPDVTQTFDLDGSRLVALAAELEIIAAVPETPTAPPVRGRPDRLFQKQRAGASLAVLNHVPTPSAVARFVTAARSAGLTIPVLAAVAVFADVVSAAVLQGLPGLELDQQLVDGVVNAADPVEAGIEAAVSEGRALLAIEGVEGVNLSGLASGAGTRVSDQGRGRCASPSRNDLVNEAMNAEFDTIAEWTAQVAAELGPAFRIPAGCRGSGSPAALDWLMDRLGLEPGEALLDCGAGVGGPAAYAARQRSLHPVLIEPEAGACRAARSLFSHPVVQADAAALPLADESFDAAWSLGVLCTMRDQWGY